MKTKEAQVINRPSQYDEDEAKRARKREKARAKILKKANQHPKYREAHLSSRHIYQAVRICRVWGLVKDEVLVEAGFNPVKGTRS